MAQLTINYVHSVGSTPELISHGGDPLNPVENRRAIVVRNVGNSIVHITGDASSDPSLGLKLMPNEVLSDTVHMGDMWATCIHDKSKGTLAVAWVKGVTLGPTGPTGP